MEPDSELIRILLHAFPGCRIGACARLAGGVSSRAVVVDISQGGRGPTRVVVRRPTRDTHEEALLAAETEYQLLLRCAANGIAAPAPYALDREAGAVLLEYIVGSPDLMRAKAPQLLQPMAQELCQIHRFAPVDELPLLQRYTDRRARELLRRPQTADLALGEAQLRAVLDRLWPWPQYNSDALLHGDYWPGNLLWNSDHLVAVLDWEGAAIGDPLVDLAIARLDILWAFGEGAMHAFTQHYRDRTELDWRNLARWDLLVALRPMSNLARWAPAYAHPPICRPDITELTMREGHHYFVSQALRSLGFEP